MKGRIGPGWLRIGADVKSLFKVSKAAFRLDALPLEFTFLRLALQSMLQRTLLTCPQCRSRKIKISSRFTIPKISRQSLKILLIKCWNVVRALQRPERHYQTLKMAKSVFQLSLSQILTKFQTSRRSNLVKIVVDFNSWNSYRYKKKRITVFFTAILLSFR